MAVYGSLRLLLCREIKKLDLLRLFIVVPPGCNGVLCHHATRALGVQHDIHHTRLRANGFYTEIIEDFPFVLSLSKHERRLPATYHLGKLYQCSELLGPFVADRFF